MKDQPYQVRATLGSRLLVFGLILPPGADPRPVVLGQLGPAWFGSRIEIEPILPRDDRPGRSSGRDA